jgi:GNAT superfamily N-acetyltransferase
VLEPDEIDAVHADLLRAGVIARAAPGGPDEQAWLDCDLASLAENRLGDRLDPRDLDGARRAEWQSRAVGEPTMALERRERHERCYWLIEDGQRAGTIALATGTLGTTRLHVGSFYVLPSHRGRGVGRRAMASLMAVLANHHCGLRLDTSWCWQRTVKFYMSLGLWLYMWKRELTLCWDPRTPAPRLEVGEQTASLSVPLQGSHVVLARAHRRGEVLELEQPPPGVENEERIGEAYWHAQSTLALALALHGWPLVRSSEAWESSYWADARSPEALAYKITVWEALARKHGWLVPTPRIPGLAYPTWDELEARWDAEARELVLPGPTK